MTTKRTALVLLPLTPIVFIVALASYRTGRDLTAIYLWGCGAMSLVGIVLVGRGLLKHRRELTKSGAALICLVVLTVLACAKVTKWIGAKTTELVVVVKDAETGMPISDANVRVFEYEENAASKGATGQNGTAELKHTFTVTGSDSLLETKGWVRLWNQTVLVDAPGYQSIRATLDAFTQSSWDLYDLPIPPVEVQLKRK